MIMHHESRNIFSLISFVLANNQNKKIKNLCLREVVLLQIKGILLNSVGKNWGNPLFLRDHDSEFFQRSKQIHE